MTDESISDIFFETEDGKKKIIKEKNKPRYPKK